MTSPCERLLRSLLPAVVLVVAGCPSEDGPGPTPTRVEEQDSDGDGWLDSEDCAPDDAAVNPGAEEACDGLDTDCDGSTGPGEVDDDGDGVLVCAGDCDDSNPEIRPGAREACNGVDDDCDGEIPPGETPPSSLSDDDGDGWSECLGDCDDEDPARHPLASDICNGGIDDNCDGHGPDSDFDEDGVTECDGDCDDDVAHIHPGAEEQADRRDDDCNGLVDDCEWNGPGLPGGTIAPTEAFATFAGSQDDEYYGNHLGTPGDVDGDGYDDILVGTLGLDVDLFFGPFCPGTYRRSHADVRFVVVAPVTGSFRLASVGDVDGDGLDDVRIGPNVFFAPLGRSPEERADRFGQVAVLEPDLYVAGGRLLMSPGDLNGDGSADLVLGRPLAFHPSVPVSKSAADYGPGVVSVFFGPFEAGPTRWLYPEDADAELVGETWDVFAGDGLAAPGDVNGDGRDDLVVGASRDQELVDWGGAVYLVLDVPAGVTSLSDAAKKWPGANEGHRAGANMELLEDGVVLVNGRWANAFVLALGAEPGPLGSTSTEIGVSNSGNLAARPAVVGDTSGDGSADYLVGNSVAAYLVREPTGDSSTVNIDELAETVAVEEYLLGYYLGAAGDVNRDGYADWLVGSPLDFGHQGGRAYLFLGYPPPAPQR